MENEVDVSSEEVNRDAEWERRRKNNHDEEVSPSVRLSVRHTVLFFVFAVFGLTAPAKMIN